MPRFRVGRSVPINAYDGNDPIFQGHSPEEVAELVRLLNLGARSEEFTDAYTGSLRDAMGLTPPDAPPSAHESPSKPPAATGQPADDSGPQVLCYSCRTGDHGCCTGPPSGLPLLDDPCQCTAPSHELD